ncbi:DUF4097 family beta strand repeat-containing protein [Fibrella aquatica]|uniref:DUF4097 family beta strand repeat-containing protein n=1 Tax=Fibrella aquatica TaxID=3242487 RepID=UPI003521CC99
MNNLLITIVLMLAAASTPLLAQTDVKEQLVIPLTDAGKPAFLEVGLFKGFIHVSTHAGKDVIIDATSPAKQPARGEEKPNASGMKRIQPSNPFDLSAEEKNNRVKVSTSLIHGPVNLTIKVPRQCSLKLNTVDEGDISVENVVGELEINNVNGPIELTNVSGSVVANTINGDLKATFREVNANTPMAFSTLNGKVDVTFPASVKANVKLKSDMGDIFSDFDIAVDKSQPKATRSSQTGMYRVKIDDWVNGKINSGGPEVMMKTMQGSIYVRKAK